MSSNVRFGSKADIARCPSHVRFTRNSGHEIAIRDLWNLSVALEPKMSALLIRASKLGRFYRADFCGFCFFGLLACTRPIAAAAPMSKSPYQSMKKTCE